MTFPIINNRKYLVPLLPSETCCFIKTILREIIIRKRWETVKNLTSNQMSVLATGQAEENLIDYT
jgi:hypothetical protein